MSIREEKNLIRCRKNNKDFVSVSFEKGTKAFCSGGDQALRSADGYADFENFGRLNVLDLQVQIRRLPKGMKLILPGRKYLMAYGSVVSIFLLVGVVLSGAALEYWVMQKFIISEARSVNVGIAQFVKWVMRIIAMTIIFQALCRCLLPLFPLLPATPSSSCCLPHLAAACCPLSLVVVVACCPLPLVIAIVVAEKCSCFVEKWSSCLCVDGWI